MARTHVILPDDLIQEIDRVVGRRRRSEFLAAAARERLQRLVLKDALTKGAGLLRGKDYPEWSTPEKTSAWVRELRRADIERAAHVLEPNERP